MAISMNSPFPPGFWTRLGEFGMGFPVSDAEHLVNSGVLFSVQSIFTVIARKDGLVSSAQLPMPVSNVCKEGHPITPGQKQLLVEKCMKLISECYERFALAKPSVIQKLVSVGVTQESKDKLPDGAVLQHLPPQFKTQAPVWFPNMPEIHQTSLSKPTVTGVSLKSATHLGQFVQGFGSALYRVVALGPRIRMAAMWANSKLSLRIETCKNMVETKDELEVMKDYGFEEKPGYWSLHVGAHMIKSGRHRALMGQIIFALCEVGAFSHILTMRSLWGDIK